MDDAITGRKLALTIYRNIYDNTGRSATTSWDTLVPLLTNHDVRKEKDGKLFSPHKLVSGGKRAAVNVDYMSMAVADIDNGTHLSDLMPVIGSFEWVAYSSFRHTDGHPKYRIVFPLTRDIAGSEWSPLWLGFNSTLLQENNDRATKDASRMFYLPSCSPEVAPEKFVIHNKGEWLNPDICFAAAMLDTGVVPESMGTKPLENEFGGPREFPPSSLEKVAEKCAVIQWFKKTGAPNEPLWFMALGSSYYSVDGLAKAHEWSKQYAGYDPAVTQAKLDYWENYTAPSCAKFKELMDPKMLAELGETLCTTCTETCTNPLQLGYVLAVDPPVVAEETPEGVVTQTVIPHWPTRFTRMNGGIYRQVEQDGQVDHVAVCTPVFYLTERIKDEEGTFVYKARMNVKGNQWREFEIPAKTTAEIRGLKSLLASYEIVVFSDKQLETYMNDYKIALRQYMDEVQTFKQFGWTKEKHALLVGDRLVTLVGSTTVRVAGMHDFMITAGKVRGTKKEWADGVDKLYNQPNGEPYQYSICYQFGVPLISLVDLEEWSGILFAFTSNATGIGKSTSVKIGSNALLNTSGPIMTNGTPKSVIARAAAMGTLPLIWDEVQSLDPEQFTEMTFNIFQGRKRAGLNSDGTERDVGEQFKSGITMTSNNSAWDLVAQAKPPSVEAALMRIFEIGLDDYPPLDNAGNSVLAAHLASDVYGVWTEDYVRFVLAHREAVEDKLHRTILALRNWAGPRAAPERFFIYQIACTIVGGWIAKKIGAVQFDITALFHWCKDHVKRLRRKLADNMLRIEDQFSAFLSDLHGNILVTKHYEVLDARAHKTEVPMLQIRGVPKARLVLGGDLERPRLMVSIRAIDDWCTKQKIVSSVFKKELMAAKLIRPSANGKGHDHKVSLGKGVPTVPSGQVRCYEFDYALANGYKEEHVDSKVVDINSKKQLPVAETVAEEETGTA